MKVYFRDVDNGLRLGCIDVDTYDHEEAILCVKEALVLYGNGFVDPVVAVLQGGAA